MSKAKPDQPVADSADRFARAGGAEPTIETDGGRFGAGIIRGVALATVGEALGHEQWLDQTTIEQVTHYAAAKGDAGLKARFTHPSMSSDGTGKLLGRIYDVRTEGEKSVGDLHLAESATQTPDGNLAEYVLQLTAEDPTAAGLSIVFHHDADAETEFQEQHLEQLEQEDSRGRVYKYAAFRSPDKRNANNYPHVRLAGLRAADMVDEPAANPDGLFDRSPLARSADALLSYAAGLTEQRPAAVESFGIDDDRAKQFFNRWLSSHGLQIKTKTELSEMDNANETNAPQTEPVTRETLLAEQQRYVDRFGAVDGVQWFGEGKSYTDALELFAGKQAEQIEQLTKALEAAEEKLAAVDLGEETPLETAGQSGRAKPAGGKIENLADVFQPAHA